MKKFWKKTEGFTLVELIVVIAILGILAGVGTVGYSGYIKKANMAADQQLVRDVMTAVELAAVTEQQSIGDATGIIGTITLKQDGTVVEDTTGFSQTALTNSFGNYEGLKLRYAEWADDGLLAAMGDVNPTYLQEVPNSTYITNIGTETLLGDVQDCATAFSGFLGQISAGNPKDAVEALNSALNNELSEDELTDSAFMQYLKSEGYVNGEDYSNVNKEMLANATVFGVAEKVKENQSGVIASFQNMYKSKTYQNVPLTSSLYDVAYWYAATEAVVGYLDDAQVREQFKAIDMSSNNAAAIIGQMNLFAEKLNANTAVSDKLESYYSTRQARKDAAAFIAVMSTVNGVSREYKEDAGQMNNGALFTSGDVLNRVNSMVGLIPVMGSVEDGTITIVVSWGNGKVTTAVTPSTAIPNG